MHTKKHASCVYPRCGLRLRTLAAALATLTAAPSQAFQFENGELTGSLDTTVTAGAAWRVEGRDRGLVGIANGGSAYSVNVDNGNLNYNTGIVSSALRVNHDLEIKYQNLGAFARVYYFYDYENEKGHRAKVPLTDAAKELVGSDVRLLDAYIRGQFDLDGKPLNLRLGKQVVSWGESTFIPNGINVINPVDVTKLRQPGAEIRDALLPVPMLWGSLGIAKGLSVEGFYQTHFEHTDIDPPGTYFATNDFAGKGGDSVFVGFGSIPDTSTSSIYRVPRAADRNASDSGQYGLALRWFAPQLNETEFAFYHVNYHSRLPLISAKAATTIVGGSAIPSSGRYFIEYPEDIKLFGASFNTSLGATGVALQGELAHHKDVPLQVDDVELLFSALCVPLSQLGACPNGLGGEISGYRRHDVTQAQLTATKSFGPALGADQWVLVGEVGATQVHNLPPQSTLRYDGPGTFTSGSTTATALKAQPATQTDGFADAFSWGYRMIARFEYNNAIGAVTLTPSVAFAHDVNGTTPLPLGNFVEGRKALTFGLGASYQNTWSGDLSYTRFYGGGDFNLLRDRDYVSINIKYSK